MAQNTPDRRKADGPPFYIGVPGFGGNISSTRTEPIRGNVFMCLLCLKGSELKRRESRGGDDQQEICPRIAVYACKHSQYM